jgi:hypothetical protein
MEVVYAIFAVSRLLNLEASSSMRFLKHNLCTANTRSFRNTNIRNHLRTVREHV